MTTAQLKEDSLDYSTASARICCHQGNEGWHEGHKRAAVLIRRFLWPDGKHGCPFLLGPCSNTIFISVRRRLDLIEGQPPHQVKAHTMETHGQLEIARRFMRMLYTLVHAFPDGRLLGRFSTAAIVAANADLQRRGYSGGKLIKTPWVSKNGVSLGAYWMQF